MKPPKKFKPGDRVIVVDAASTSAPESINGKSFIVRRCGEDSKYHYCDLEGSSFSIYEHGLVHDYAYDSPLWQELR